MPPERTRAQRIHGRAARHVVRDDFGPFSPVDWRPGREPVRMERARGDRARYLHDEGGHRCDLPHRALSPGHRGAQASATVASMMPGRFFLSLGSGEALNEHILGRHWPPPPQRLEMLAEAITIIRRLWSGEEVTHRGEHFTVEDAQLYTLPDQPPPLNVAASGSVSATLAGANDGLVATSPSRDLVASFDAAGGRSKPKYGQLTVCWGPDRSQAIRTAAEQWPNVLIPGQLNAEIARPAYFEMLTKEPDLDKLAKLVACGPDPRPFLDMMHKYTDAGFDHLCFHQVG